MRIFWRLLAGSLVVAVTGVGTTMLVTVVLGRPEAPGPIPSATVAGVVAGLVLAGGVGALLAFSHAKRVSRLLATVRHPVGPDAEPEPLQARPGVATRPADELAELQEGLTELHAEAMGKARGQQRAESRLQAVLSHLGEAVLATDARGTIVLWNPRAEEVFGVPAQRALGHRTSKVLRHHELDRLFRHAAVRQAPQSARIELHLPRRRTLLAGVSPVPVEAVPGATDDDTAELGAVAVFTDVTEMEHERISRRHLAADVAGKLRPVLAGLRGLTVAISHSAADTARDDCVHLEAEISRLARLTDELVALSRLDTDAVPPRTVAVDRVLAEVAERYRQTARQKRVALRCLRPPEALPQVSTDPSRLAAIIAGLVDNAIKFTPAGGSVTIRVQPAGNELTISVWDTGCGIPEEDLPRIFERFYRVERPHDQQRPGAGLGLTVSKHMADTIGARLEVTSEEGKGSRFTLHLPL